MAGRPLTVLHTSDFQCGAPFLPQAANAMLRVAESVRPDVVVCSGDLTQRAKTREFELARRTLDRFGDVPIVVTPGNHDVPLYRVWERIGNPYRNWRRFAGPDLDTVTSVPGATFVALNSSAPRRAIVNGRIDDDQLEFARAAFTAAPADHVRVLVIHHHFVPIRGGEGGRPLPGAKRLAQAFEEMGAHVVLGGHVHQLHFHTSAELRQSSDPRGVPLLASGTSTSRRGRGPEAGWNSLSVVVFDAGAIRVTPYLRAPSAADFEPLEAIVFAAEQERVE